MICGSILVSPSRSGHEDEAACHPACDHKALETMPTDACRSHLRLHELRPSHEAHQGKVLRALFLVGFVEMGATTAMLAFLFKPGVAQGCRCVDSLDHRQHRRAITRGTRARHGEDGGRCVVCGKTSREPDMDGDRPKPTRDARVERRSARRPGPGDRPGASTSTGPAAVADGDHTGWGLIGIRTVLKVPASSVAARQGERSASIGRLPAIGTQRSRFMTPVSGRDPNHPSFVRKNTQYRVYGLAFRPDQQHGGLSLPGRSKGV